MANVWMLGGTSGLGKEMARNALECGDKVAILGRSAGELSTQPPFDSDDVWRVNLDLRQSPFLTQGIRRAMDVLPPDTFVWASGIAQNAGYLDLSFSDVDEILNVHLRGPLHLLSRVLNHAKSMGRAIQLVVVSSTSAYRARDDEEVYCLVNAGKSAFARQVSRTLARDLPGSCVLLANVGGMNTPFWQGSATDASSFLDPSLIAELLWHRTLSLRDVHRPFEEVNILRSHTEPYDVVMDPQTPELPF